jgi:GDP-L-fucose synthase
MTGGLLDMEQKMINGKNVLVSGAAGLAGHEAVSQLLDRGAFVRATVYNDPNYNHRQLAISHKNLEVVYCDLMDYAACQEVVRDIDIVINCLAVICGAKGQTENPLSLIRRNLIPYINLIETSVGAGVEKFGFISSSTVYPDVSHPVREEEAFMDNPADCYYGFGWMKRYCEKLCKNFHIHSKTKFGIIRTGSIYGPYDVFDADKSHVIPALILKAVRYDDPFEIWGTGEQRRDFVYVKDVIEGLLVVLEKHAVADPINIATGRSVNINEIVDIMLRNCQYNPEIIHLSTNANMIASRFLDVSKAKDLLGWESSVSVEEGIQRTINWKQEH